MLFFQCACLFLPLASLLQTISGRDEKDLYRIKTPEEWTTVRNTNVEALQDTKNPLQEFYIRDPDGDIKITIHNFPSQKIEDRIPPLAQVSRWERQFNPIDPTHQSIIPQSFSGFVGLCYEGKGILNGKEITMLAWAMQLGSEHYRTLSRPHFPLEMRSDVTIKATGPSNAIASQRDAIISFARSFELIEEIP